MRKIGIIGGLAWPSTVDYYRMLCERAGERAARDGAAPPYPTPPIVIESLDITQMRALRGEPGDDASWAAYEATFHDAFRRLRAAGARIGLIACNTPHSRFAGITRGLDLPIINILDTTADAARASGRRRALVLGTPLTMHGDAYPGALRSRGIEPLAVPDAEVVASLDRLIDVDLAQGRIDGAAQRILAACRASIDDPEDVSVCLACTELPRAFSEHQDDVAFRVDGFSFVNTSAAHVASALEASFDDGEAAP